MPKQTCSLCGGKAGFVVIDFGRKKKFDCANCGSYVISPGTEKKIPEISQDQKNNLVAACRSCQEGKILSIYRNDGSNGIDSRCEPEEKWS